MPRQAICGKVITAMKNAPGETKETKFLYSSCHKNSVYLPLYTRYYVVSAVSSNEKMYLTDTSFYLASMVIQIKLNINDLDNNATLPHTLSLASHASDDHLRKLHPVSMDSPFEISHDGTPCGQRHSICFCSTTGGCAM